MISHKHALYAFLALSLIIFASSSSRSQKISPSEDTLKVAASQCMAGQCSSGGQHGNYIPVAESNEITKPNTIVEPNTNKSEDTNTITSRGKKPFQSVKCWNGEKVLCGHPCEGIGKCDRDGNCVDPNQVQCP